MKELTQKEWFAKLRHSAYAALTQTINWRTTTPDQENFVPPFTETTLRPDSVKRWNRKFLEIDAPSLQSKAICKTFLTSFVFAYLLFATTVITSIIITSSLLAPNSVNNALLWKKLSAATINSYVNSGINSDVRSDSKKVHTQGSDGEPAPLIDVVVLLDDSGSMATCWPWSSSGSIGSGPCVAPSVNLPSDLSELRYSAARLLVELADADDRVAIVRFDVGATGIGELNTLRPVGVEAGRPALSASLIAPTDYNRRGFTRLDLGLAQAIQLLEASRQADRSQYVLLLTDGEPTEPGGQGQQKARIRSQLQTLRANNVLVFPVVLCNPTAGCSGEFLRQEFASFGVRDAASAPDLLRVFSEIFSEMKPDRTVLTARTTAQTGSLSFVSSDAQGVRKLTVVAPRGGLGNVQLDGSPFLLQPRLSDPNIEVNALRAEGGTGRAATLPSGRWVIETSGVSGFAVVQATSYPELLNPPPSLANSPASVRYYPAGKPPLLIARGVGANSDEPLLYDGQTPMQPFGDSGSKALILDVQPSEARIQLGTQSTPLKLEKTFRFEPRSDIPKAQVFTPIPTNLGLLNDGRALLQVGFDQVGELATSASDSNASAAETSQESATSILNVAATAYVMDISPDVPRDEAGNVPLVYSAKMNCNERLCSDERFTPGDGRQYRITYIIEGNTNGVRFSDWAQTELALEPAVFLRGLPNTIDLEQMPVGGWPVVVGAGTTDEIGSLIATLSLRRRGEDGTPSLEPVTDVTLDFAEDVPEKGTVESKLKVEGVDQLRPGNYEGEIILSATTPSGRPMDVQLRPGSILPVHVDVARPTMRFDRTSADFGAVLFETSSNFRLDQEILLPIEYDAAPFKVAIESQDSSCAGINIEIDSLQSSDAGMMLPLRLTSQESILPQTCTGLLVLAGPTVDYDIFPATLEWQARVDAVEWSIASSEINLDDLGNAGERVEALLSVRFNGVTPFTIKAENISAVGKTRDGEVFALSSEDIEFAPIEVNFPPDENDLYEVPVVVTARKILPNDPLRGTFYSGEIALGIEGLSTPPRPIGFNFRSPTLYQRYVAPIVVPVYSLPWGLCTWPLTLLLLILAVARFRGRDFDKEDWDEAVIATVGQANSTGYGDSSSSFGGTPDGASAQYGSEGGTNTASSAQSADPDSMWGHADWGVTSTTSSAGVDDPFGTVAGEPPSESWSSGPAIDHGSQPNTPPPSGDDPWQSSW